MTDVQICSSLRKKRLPYRSKKRNVPSQSSIVQCGIGLATWWKTRSYSHVSSGMHGDYTSMMRRRRLLYGSMTNHGRGTWCGRCRQEFFQLFVIRKWWLISSFSQSNLGEPERRPFCIILYADKSKLSSFGTQKGYPVVLRCANLPVTIRNGQGLGGGIVIGWLPIVCHPAK